MPPPDKKLLKLMIMEFNKLLIDMHQNQLPMLNQVIQKPLIKLHKKERLMVKPLVMPLKPFKNKKKDKKAKST